MEFLNNWVVLSDEGIFGAVFDLLGDAGSWADAVSKLLGLL